MICNKHHMEMPPGYDILRCRHGRIGNTALAVIEAFDKANPNHGVTIYGQTDDQPDTFSLVRYHDYAAETTRTTREIIWDLYGFQLENGQIPLCYIAQVQQAAIIGIQHTEGSINALRKYSETHGFQVPDNAIAILLGKQMNPGLN